MALDIELSTEGFEFVFSPDGSPKSGELRVFDEDSTEYVYGAKIDLSSTQSRSRFVNAASELHEDLDVVSLMRGLNDLYADVDEKARKVEAEREAEEEDNDAASVDEEAAEALIKDPGVLERYVEDMAEIGAVHEDRPYMKTVTLGGLSAQLDLSFNRPLGTNVVLTGESGRGKNYIPDAVAQGMPDEFVYPFESASAKSFYYQADADPDRFRHTWVYPNEAEATDSLIETLRPLLSKGSAEHGTVDAGADGANAFRSLTVRGPITVTIPTVRNKLDGQLQTRMLLVEMEDYEGRVAGHTEKFSDTLLPDYVEADHGGTLAKWKAALKTLTEVRKVVLPGKVEGFRYDNDGVSHGSRVWRNLTSFMLTHAWLEQRNRRKMTLKNGEEAVVVTAEDYRVGYDLFKEVATRSVFNLGPKHKKICDAVYALQNKSKSESRLVGRGFSVREVAREAGINHQTVQANKTYLIASEGLLREGEKGGLLLVDGAEPVWWNSGNLLKGLPTPEDVEEWWRAFDEGVDTVDSDEKPAGKPIDKANEVSTEGVDSKVDSVYESVYPPTPRDSPIDKPNRDETSPVSTVSTPSENGQSTKERKTELGSYEYVDEE